ncbi:MAG: MATE family efflux transporter, partial [Thermoproteota archaeon]
MFLCIAFIGGDLRMSPSGIDKYRDSIVSGPILPTMLRLGLPLMLTDVIMLVYNVTDAYWLSRYSQYALAVPRMNWPIFLAFVSIVMGITNANLAMLSQYVGAKRYDKVSDVSSKLFTLCTATSTALFLIYEAFRHHIFAYLIMVPSEILEEALGYAEVIAFDFLAFGVAMSLATIMQSFGDTRTPAALMGAGALMNLALDPMFIIGLGPIPAMGARGAAIATVVTRLLSGMIMLRIIMARYPEVKIGFTRKIDRDWLLLSLKIGIPITIMTASDGFAFIFHQALVNMFGVVVAAAFAIGYIVLDMASAVLRGFTMSISIMVGQNLGAGNSSRARKTALTAAHTIMLLVFIGSIVVYLGRNHLISVFASDGAVMLEAERLVSIIAWILPLMMLSFLGMSVGRGSGHTVVPTV